jgi:hypothetical protein
MATTSYATANTSSFNPAAAADTNTNFQPQQRHQHQLACLYTKHKTQKKKTWIDGRLVIKGTRAVLHDANPPPGSSDPALDECEITHSQYQNIIQNQSAGHVLETERFLIDVEGPWVAPSATGPVNNAGSMTSSSHHMQKLLQKTGFKRPNRYVPPPPHARSARSSFDRLHNALEKRRRPLQPGELVAMHYGGGGFGPSSSPSLSQSNSSEAQGRGYGSGCGGGGNHGHAGSVFGEQPESTSPPQQSHPQHQHLHLHHQYPQNQQGDPSYQHRSFHHDNRVSNPNRINHAVTRSSNSQQPIACQKQQQQQTTVYETKTNINSQSAVESKHQSDFHPQRGPAATHYYSHIEQQQIHHQQQPENRQLPNQVAGRHRNFDCLFVQNDDSAGDFYGWEDDDDDDDAQNGVQRDIHQSAGADYRHDHTTASIQDPGRKYSSHQNQNDGTTRADHTEIGTTQSNIRKWDTSDEETSKGGGSGSGDDHSGVNPAPKPFVAAATSTNSGGQSNTTKAITGSQLLALFGAPPPAPSATMTTAFLQCPFASSLQKQQQQQSNAGKENLTNCTTEETNKNIKQSEVNFDANPEERFGGFCMPPAESSSEESNSDDDEEEGSG